MQGSGSCSQRYHHQEGVKHFLPSMAAGAWASSSGEGRPPAPLSPVLSGRGWGWDGQAYLAIHNACLLQGDLWLGQQLPALVATHLPEAGLPLHYQKLL